MGFLRKNNGAWQISAITACLENLLFLQMLLKLVQNTLFGYFGMGRNKDNKPTTIFHSLKHPLFQILSPFSPLK